MTLPGAIERSFPDAVISERAERLHMLFQVPLTNFEKPFTGHGWSWMCSCACEFSRTLGKILPTLAGAFGELSNPQVKLCLPYKDKRLSSMLPQSANISCRYRMCYGFDDFTSKLQDQCRKLQSSCERVDSCKVGWGEHMGAHAEWFHMVCVAAVLIRTRCAKHTSQKLKTEGACGSN